MRIMRDSTRSAKACGKFSKAINVHQVETVITRSVIHLIRMKRSLQQHKLFEFRC
jgi:hypothetical protein